MDFFVNFDIVLIVPLYNNLFKNLLYLKIIYKYPPVAQLVEQQPFKLTVAGSIPAGRTKNT